METYDERERRTASRRGLLSQAMELVGDESPIHKDLSSQKEAIEPLDDLPPFGEVESLPRFQAMPLADKLRVIDDYMDDAIGLAGPGSATKIVDFGRQVKGDYLGRELKRIAEAKLPETVTGQERGDSLKRIIEEAYEDVESSRFNPSPDSGVARIGGWKPRHGDLHDVIISYLDSDKTRSGSDLSEIDLGGGVKLGARQVPHPRRDIYEFTMPDGKSVMKEGADMESAAQEAVRENLGSFPNTGGDVAARAVQGFLKDGFIKAGEGLDFISASTATRAFQAPWVLGAGMAGRATGSYEQTMAPLVEQDRKLQRAIFDATRADTLNSLVDKIAPLNPKEAAESYIGENNEILRALPGAVGQGLSSIVIGLASGPVAPGTLFLSNFLMAGDAAAGEAMSAGKPEAAASAFFATGASSGALETVADVFFTKSFSKAFGKTLEKAKPGTWSGAMERFETAFRESLSGAGTEAGTESLQQIAANQVARSYYDENRDLFEGVPESAAIGALTGAILGGSPDTIGAGIDLLIKSKKAGATELIPGDGFLETLAADATEEAATTPEMATRIEVSDRLRASGMDTLADALDENTSSVLDEVVDARTSEADREAMEVAARMGETDGGLAKEGLNGGRATALNAERAQADYDPEATARRNKELFPDSTDFGGKLDHEAGLSSYSESNGIGTAVYTNPANGSQDVFLSAFGDNDFIAYIRIYENGKPTNRFASKLERRTDRAGATRQMVEGLQYLLPENHEYTEDVSVSTDGLRFIASQLEKGYELARNPDGSPVTQRIAINGESKVNELGDDVLREGGAFQDIQVTGQEQFERVRSRLAPLLEKFGAGLTAENVVWENGRVFIDMPVLRRKSDASGRMDASSLSSAEGSGSLSDDATASDDTRGAAGGDGSLRGAGHGRRVPLRPGDWHRVREASDPRGDGGRAAEAVRNALSGLPSQMDGPATQQWAEVTAPAEIAAVAAGRKPVFHEHLGDHMAETADAIAAGLANAFPSLRVESFDGHIVVADPETAGVIAGTTDPEATMEAVREAVRSDNVGEFLGYGAAHWSEEGTRSVEIRRPDGSVVAGFHAPSESAHDFANDRLEDYRSATGEEFTVRVAPPFAGSSLSNLVGNEGQPGLPSVDERQAPSKPSRNRRAMESAGGRFAAVAQQHSDLLGKLESLGVEVHVARDKAAGERWLGKPLSRAGTAVTTTKGGKPVVVLFQDQLDARDGKGDTKQAREALARTLLHESVHAAQRAFVSSSPEAAALASKAAGAFRKGSPDYDADLHRFMRKEYRGFDSMSPRQQVAEAVRAVVEGRYTGRTSSTHFSRYLKAFLDYIKKAFQGDSSPALRELVAGVEAVLGISQDSADLNVETVAANQQAATPEAKPGKTPSNWESRTSTDIRPDDDARSARDRVLSRIPLSGPLEVHIVARGEGGFHVERHNTETGRTLPLDGAPDAGFASLPEANAFLRRSFATDEGGNVIPEAKSPTRTRAAETDPLMLLIQAEGGMRPVQRDIAEIGRIARAKDKGMRGLARDTGNRGDYDGVPLLREYTGEARERLRHIYDRDSRSRPDQIAQIAYDAGLIPDPSPSALFQSIRNRLEKTGGEAQITSSEQAEAAASAHEQGLTDRYDAFVSAIASPFRPDGADARTLRPGDTLEIGGETVTVVGRDEEGVELESGQWGRVYFASDEWIGYDKVLEDGGVPVEGRESLPEGQEVSREDAAESTRQIAAAMERGGIDTAPGGTRAVTSRRHTAMSKDRRGLEAARRLAALFGVRVVGVEGSPGNGFVLPGDKTRTVYIATDASRPEFLLVAHEMLHRMKNDAPALYRDVLDIISSEADFHAYLAELRPEHARHDADYIIEEFIADYLSDLMGTDRFWRSLADRDPSLFERFAQYVLDFLRSVRDQIASGRLDTERYLRDAARAENALLDALVDFRKRKTQVERGVLPPEALEASHDLDGEMPFADRRFPSSRLRSRSFTFSPSEVGFSYGQARRELSGQVVESNAGRPVSPDDAGWLRDSGISDFENATGSEVQFFRSETADSPDGYVNVVRGTENVIFINADSQAPLGWLLGHEFLHLASHDPASGFAGLRDSIHSLLLPEERAGLSDALAKAGYSPDEIGTEIATYLFGDAVSGFDGMGIGLLKHRKEIERLCREFFDAKAMVSPTSLGQSADSELSRDMRGPVRRDEAPPSSSGRTSVEPGTPWMMFADQRVLTGPGNVGISAWHGTPHEVDEFSTDRIGTGEGAQAYGWGLYFAENRQVADDYRKKLTVSENYVDGELLDSYNPRHLLARTLAEESGNIDEARDGLKRLALPGGDPDIRKSATAALDLLEKGDRPVVESIKPDGNLYQVRLKPEVDEMLDWDKPLGDQSERVREAARAILRDFGGDSFLGASLRAAGNRGAGLYAGISDAIEKNQHRYQEKYGRDVRNAPDKVASLILGEYGIKGVRYLDGSSRKEGEGTYNYVIFDENDIEITSRNGEPVGTAGQMLFSDRRDTPRNPEAEAAIDTEMERLRAEGRIRDDGTVLAPNGQGSILHKTLLEELRLDPRFQAVQNRGISSDSSASGEDIAPGSQADIEARDAAYFDALERRDRVSVQRLIMEAVGYRPADSSIDRGGAHSPADPESGAPAWDLTGNEIYPEDVYSHNGLRYYGTGDESLDREAYSEALRLKGHADRFVKIYRAIEKSDKRRGIEAGAWVTTSKRYAVEHGEAALGGDYRVQSKRVMAGEIFTSGDSWLEWGYHPQPKGALYRLRPVARDSSGDIIPPSKRFPANESTAPGDSGASSSGGESITTFSVLPNSAAPATYDENGETFSILPSSGRDAAQIAAQYLEEAGKPFEELSLERQKEMLAEAERQTEAELSRLRSESRIKPDGTVLAPNGKASELHQTLLEEVGDPDEAMRRYAMVHTPFFKRWFGDWENDPANASKVRDANGEPMVVWHGTKNVFDTFDAGRSIGGAFFFSTQPEGVTGYAATGNYGAPPVRIAAFLNLRNPKVFGAGMAADFIGEPSLEEVEMDRARKEGHDSLVADTGDNEVFYIAFRAAQIKSATGNDGSFGPREPSILFADRRALDEATKNGGEMVRTGDGNLVAVHNLSERALHFAIDNLGAIPPPSIAIVRADKSHFDNFGDITLVLPPDAVDPRNGRVRVWNADAYTPRFPTVSHKGDYKAFEESIDPIREVEREFDVDWGDALNFESVKEKGSGAYENSTAPMVLFLRGRGMEPSREEEESSYRFKARLRDQIADTGLRDEFLSWIESTYGKALGERVIRDGYTASGSPRFRPFTLENVVKMMTAKTRAGEGFNYGVGSVRAKQTKEFKTLEGIRKDRDKIVPKEEMDAEKSRLEQEFERLGEAFGPYYQYSRSNLMSFSESLIDGTWRNDYRDAPAALKKELSSFLAGLKTAPTEYFEAKGRDAFRLNDFRGAVIPKTATRKTREMFGSRGIPVAEYDQGTPGSRSEALASLAEDRQILFADRRPGFSFRENPWTEELTGPIRALQYSEDYGLDGRSAETLRGAEAELDQGPLLGTNPLHAPWLGAFEAAVGVPVQFYRGGGENPSTVGFVSQSNPAVMFVNAGADAPVASVIAHEWAHLAEYDPEKRDALFAFFPRIRRLLDVVALKHRESVMATSGLYDARNAGKEVLFNLLSDALTGLDFWNSAGTATSPEAWQEIRREAEELFANLNPVSPAPFGQDDTADYLRFSDRRDPPDLSHGAFTRSPNSLTFEPDGNAAFRTREILSEIHCESRKLHPSERGADHLVQSFEAATGAKVQFYEGGAEGTLGFVIRSVPGVVHVNVAGEVPLGWTLGHETGHVASHDPASGFAEVERSVLGLLTDDEIETLSTRIEATGEYAGPEVDREIVTNLFGDALGGFDLIGLSSLTNALAIRAAIRDYFASMGSLNPSSTEDAQDSELSIRFADRRTKPNQQVFGQDIGRQDEIQSLTEEVVPKVRERYFDSAKPVSYWNTEDAFAVLADLEAGRIDPARELGLDAATQTLKGELWNYARKLAAEEGDTTLLDRIVMMANDLAEREATRSGRALQALGHYTREGAMQGTLKQVEEAKRKVVEDAHGKGAVASVEAIQADIDAIKIDLEDFTAEEIEEFKALIRNKRGKGPKGLMAQAEKAVRAAGRHGRAVAQRLQDLLTADDAVMFADITLDQAKKLAMRQRVIIEQVRTGERSKTRFVHVLVELGMSSEAAANRYDAAMAIRAEGKEARRQDEAEAKAEGRTVEQSAEDAFLEYLDNEGKEIDRLHKKVSKIHDRVEAGKPILARKKPEKRDGFENFIAAQVGLGLAFKREAAISGALALGLNQEAAASLADSIAAEIKNEAAKAAKARRRFTKTPSETAKRIGKRLKDRYENAKDRPTPKKPVNEVQALVNTALKPAAAPTKEQFVADAAALGVSRVDALDLWRDVEKMREFQAKGRRLKADAKAESESRFTTERMAAARIIANLAKSQSDTQDNRPGQPSRQSVAERLYRDMIGYGPVRSREAFVSELVEAGVPEGEASRLYDLAKRERVNRREVEVGRAATAAVERSIPYIMREILNSPALRLAGPEERRRIAASLLEERAGLSPVDARAAALRFDAMLAKKWEEAGERLAEKWATDRRSPWFRPEANAGKGPRTGLTAFDRLRRAIRSGAMDPRKRTLTELAKENGWKDLTEGEIAELSRLDAALAQEGITPFEEVRHRREMAKVVADSDLPADFVTLLQQYYLANIFSGVKTSFLQTSVVANVATNTLFRDSIGAIVGSMTGSGSLNVEGFAMAIQNLGRHVKTALTDGSLTLKTGDVRGMQDSEIVAASDSLEQVFERNMKILRNPRSGKLAKSAAIGKMILSANHFVFRVLGAADAFFQSHIRNYTKELELFSRASKLGIPPGRMKELLGETMVLSGAFAEEADAKGFSGVDKAAYVQDRISMAIFAAFEGEGVDIEGLGKAGEKEAMLETGVNDFESGTLSFGGLAKAIQTLKRSDNKFSRLLLTTTIPALKIPYNVLYRSAWYSPYGLVRLLGAGIKSGGFKDWSKTGYETSLSDPAQLMRRSLEAAIGTAITAGLATLWAMNDDEEEEDKWFRINLAGPSKANRSEWNAWSETGRKQFSIQFKVGGEWQTFGFRRGGFEIFNIAATIAGAAEQMKYNKLANSESAAMNYASTLGTELFGEALFFARSASRGGISNEETVASQAGFIVSGLVPFASLLKTPNKFLDRQEPSGVVSAFMMQMPFVPFMGESRPVLNGLGDPLATGAKSGYDVYSALGLPYSFLPGAGVKAEEKTPAGQRPDSGAIYRQLHAKGYFPSAPTRGTFKQDIPLEKYREFIKRRGVIVKDYLARSHHRLEGLTPERYKEEVSKAASDATRTTKARMGLR